jgi:quercetin dioxygenase-like cupin family protein
MKFPMIHADERGETHFGVQDIPDRELAMGPPPNPTGQMSDFGPVTTMCVFSVPAGTDAPAHKAPQPYIAIILSGEGEVVTSDGAAPRFHPGEVLFCNSDRPSHMTLASEVADESVTGMRGEGEC